MRYVLIIAAIVAPMLFNHTAPAQDVVRYNDLGYYCNVKDRQSVCLSSNEDITNSVAIIALDSLSHISKTGEFIDIVSIKFTQTNLRILMSGLDIYACLRGSENHIQFRDCIVDAVEIGEEA